MADSAGVGSPQPGDVVTEGYVQVQSQAPSTSPGDKFSLENSSDETSVRRPGTAYTMATQLGGGGTPVSAAQAESKQPQSGAERLLKMLHSTGREMQREAPRKIRLLGLPAPISGEQQPFEGQMHAGAAASSFEVASFALCPCWLVFAGKEREGSK